MKRFVKALIIVVALVLPPTTFSGEWGNVNNDDATNIFDITYLISFLYLEGPPPCICEEWTDECGGLRR